jgi:hypothetical protein
MLVPLTKIVAPGSGFPLSLSKTFPLIVPVPAARAEGTKRRNVAMKKRTGRHANLQILKVIVSPI